MNRPPAPAVPALPGPPPLDPLALLADAMARLPRRAAGGAP
jgi:hypothetical protein